MLVPTPACIGLSTPPADLARRMGAGELARLISMPVRTVQELALRGVIPAAKVGRRWLFSGLRVQEWLTALEDDCSCQPKRLISSDVKSAPKALRRATASYAGTAGGPRSSSAGSDTERAYEQLMRPKRQGG